MNKYKIIEWNINQATNIFKNNTIPDFVREAIDKMDADIIILTEFCFCKNAEEFLQKAFIEKDYNYCHTHNSQEQQNEVVIAWKNKSFPKVVEIDDKVRTTKLNNYPNYLSVALEDNQKNRITVVGARITTDKESNNRRKQMEFILERLKEISVAIIIGGDFNNYRRGFKNDAWSLEVLEKLSMDAGYKLVTPVGQSIYEAKEFNTNYEFAEDHFIVKLCKVLKVEYTREFTVDNKDIYLHGEDFQVYNSKINKVIWTIPFGSGVPDHAILYGELVIDDSKD